MTTKQKIARSLMNPINPTIIIVLGVYTTMWGLWIISPFWDVFTRAPLYDQMSHIAPEWYWGVQAIASGIFIVRGATKPSYRNLVVGSIIAFAHWLTIAILYFMGDWQNTGGITSLAFAIYSALIHINIKVNRVHFSK